MGNGPTFDRVVRSDLVLPDRVLERCQTWRT